MLFNINNSVCTQCDLSCNVHHFLERGPRGVMVKAKDSGIMVSEFELKSVYYVHFRTNTLEKGTSPLILPAMRKIVPLLFFKKDGVGSK